MAKQELTHLMNVDKGVKMGKKLIEISTDGEKYLKEVFPSITTYLNENAINGVDRIECKIDVYDVIDAFNVTDGALQHALKKILALGNRGHKDEAQDRKDILESVVRSNEIFNRKQKENM